MNAVSPQNLEHRRMLRIKAKFLAMVRGVDAWGRRFQEPTTLQNLSAGGLYVILSHSVAAGSRMFVTFRFAPTLEAPALAVAAHGVVRHSDLQPDGRTGVGLMFQRYRML